MDNHGLETIPEIEAWKKTRKSPIPRFYEAEARILMGALDRLARFLEIPLEQYNEIKQKHITAPYTRSQFQRVKDELLNGMWQRYL